MRRILVMETNIPLEHFQIVEVIDVKNLYRTGSQSSGKSK